MEKAAAGSHTQLLLTLVLQFTKKNVPVLKDGFKQYVNNFKILRICGEKYSAKKTSI